MSLFGLSGTRWITHKLNALQLMLDKFGIYLQHLQSMSEDKSFKSADRQKFKGWLRNGNKLASLCWLVFSLKSSVRRRCCR